MALIIKKQPLPAYSFEDLYTELHSVTGKLWAAISKKDVDLDSLQTLKKILSKLEKTDNLMEKIESVGQESYKKILKHPVVLEVDSAIKIPQGSYQNRRDFETIYKFKGKIIERNTSFYYPDVDFKYLIPRGTIGLVTSVAFEDLSLEVGIPNPVRKIITYSVAADFNEVRFKLTPQEKDKIRPILAYRLTHTGKKNNNLKILREMEELLGETNA